MDELISPGLRIARNAGYLFVSDIGVRLVSSLVSILVARYLGPEQFGMLAVALAFAGVAGYFTDLGVTQVMIREGTKPGVNIPHLLSGSLRLRVLLAAGAMVASCLVALFYYPSPTLRVVILVVAVPMIWGGAFRGVGTPEFGSHGYAHDWASSERTRAGDGVPSTRVYVWSDQVVGAIAISLGGGWILNFSR